LDYLGWRVYEYHREHQFVKRWQKMKKSSPEIAALAKAVEPTFRKIARKLKKS
jgi:hypothetical protein